MICPKCGGRTDVLAVKTYDDGKIRKRRCVECGYGFFTKESLSSAAEFQFRIADADRHRRDGSDERG